MTESEYQKYQNRISELEAEIEILERRLHGHREAVARWRRKANVDPPSEDMELFRIEILRQHDFWNHREYYTLPIEKSPDLAVEAWVWLMERDLVTESIKIQFDKRGWWVILEKNWRP